MQERIILAKGRLAGSAQAGGISTYFLCLSKMHFKEESALDLESSGTLAGRLSIKLPSVSQVSLFTAVTFLEMLSGKVLSQHLF